MAKKTATYGGYELRVEDNGKIVILNDAQPVQNVMGAIRTISAEVGFALDPKWNTQSSGRKLVDFLNSNATTSKSAANPSPESKANAAPSTTPKSEVKATPASSPKPEIKDISSPAPRQETKQAGRKKENELTEEEMEELLKQIAELRKTIESLESRISKLENSPSPTSSTKKGLTGTVTKNYISLSYPYIRNFVRLSNGKMGNLRPITSSDGNYTVGQTRKVAEMFGYKYDSKTKREMLGFELVSKYGDGEWAFIGKNAVDANGITYDFIETMLPYDPEYLKFATGQTKYWNDKSISGLEARYSNKPLVVDPKWTPDEIATKLFEFRNALVSK